MGHGLLHQSNTSGRIGAVLARSKDSHGLGEKVGAGGNNVARRWPERPSRFAILRDSARYPSGPRERSAKPPFVGSNPTRASRFSLSLTDFCRLARSGYHHTDSKLSPISCLENE